MKADPRFLQQSMSFWSHVRTIGQQVGYTARGTGQIRVPTLNDITTAFRAIQLGTDHLMTSDESPTPLATRLLDYFQHRANVLNLDVEKRLMDAIKAERVFKQVLRQTKSKRMVTMNKQKGDKKKPAYLTAIVNMLIESGIQGSECDFDPRELTTFTRKGVPLRTLARRVDGAFPSAVNPVAIWEIKEYYHTTTFGSRVADGVYETLLDGMELDELRRNEEVDCKHYLIVDAHYTWWECGRSYLCRIVDMLHMGIVDEVLFGTEVLERLPTLVAEWVAIAQTRITSP